MASLGERHVQKRLAPIEFRNEQKCEDDKLRRDQQYEDRRQLSQRSCDVTLQSVYQQAQHRKQLIPFASTAQSMRQAQSSLSLDHDELPSESDGMVVGDEMIPVEYLNDEALKAELKQARQQVSTLRTQLEKCKARIIDYRHSLTELQKKLTEAVKEGHTAEFNRLTEEKEQVWKLYEGAMEHNAHLEEEINKHREKERDLQKLLAESEVQQLRQQEEHNKTKRDCLDREAKDLEQLQRMRIAFEQDIRIPDKMERDPALELQHNRWPHEMSDEPIRRRNTERERVNEADLDP